jgi:hypothetical protein
MLPVAVIDGESIVSVVPDGRKYVSPFAWTFPSM